jgi:myo-inositol-1(or 4)-monophosphatase
MKYMMLRPFLEDISREAGELALSQVGRVSAEPKGASLVSEADRSVECLLLSRIRTKYPGDYVLAEESGVSGSARPAQNTRWWAIDPIDGTGPYLSDLPFWGVSIACMRGSRVEGGAVFLPAMDEMYSAVADGPPLRNGEPIPQISQTPPDDHGFLFVPCSDVDDLQIRFPGKRLALAAASLHLLYTAKGSSFGVVVEPTCAYDIAAAAFILEKAGGAVRYFSGGELNYSEIADGRRTSEPVVAAATEQVDWLRGQVNWDRG